jgi:cyclohexadieny/prephenate dehydrogenase
MTDSTLFERVTIIGFGLMGSSLARALRKYRAAHHVVACDPDENVRAAVTELDLADTVTGNPVEAARGADLVVLATPVGALGEVAAILGPHLTPSTLVTDVSSVKAAAIRDVAPALRPGVIFVPGHPVAGTEKSGPRHGFAELFEGRYCVLTPSEATPEEAVARIEALWVRLGSKVERMDPDHHDRAMAMVSHLPHLIAYTIVATATDLEADRLEEVVRYSAGGFRDFTRIAASDPIMWRDIFLANRDAVLEMLQRFTEDLTALQRAIRWGEGDALEEVFRRTRTLRRSVLEARQAGTFRPTEEHAAVDPDPLG